MQPQSSDWNELQPCTNMQEAAATVGAGGVDSAPLHRLQRHWRVSRLAEKKGQSEQVRRLLLSVLQRPHLRWLLGVWQQRVNHDSQWQLFVHGNFFFPLFWKCKTTKVSNCWNIFTIFTDMLQLDLTYIEKSEQSERSVHSTLVCPKDPSGDKLSVF